MRVLIDVAWDTLYSLSVTVMLSMLGPGVLGNRRTPYAELRVAFHLGCKAIDVRVTAPL